MPRWLAHFCIVVGWLLTPALAWVASYLGLTFGAVVAVRFTTPAAMLVTAAAGAAVLGFGTVFLWVRFMRRVPHLLSHVMAPRASQEHTAIVSGD
jgi:hypothetical protein